jgi:hypothetical protein
MNYPNQKDNPARQALTRAVDRAIAAGAPVYVNEPAPVKAYTTFADEQLVLKVGRAALVTATIHGRRAYVAAAANGYNTDYPLNYGTGQVGWNNPEFFSKRFLDRARKAILKGRGL